MSNANGKPKRKCTGCGREFTPATSWQRYHSLKCANRDRQARRAKRVRRALELMENANG